MVRNSKSSGARPKRDQAGVEREVTQLRRALTEANERETATSEILRAISRSPTDIQPVLDAVAESAARLCNADDVIIRRIEGDKTWIAAHIGPIPVQPDGGVGSVALRTIVGTVAREGRTLHIADITEPHEREKFPDAMFAGRGMWGIRTILTVPLLRENAVVGTISMRRCEVRPFTAKQIELLETFADQAVIAIENVRLFNELQARNAEITEALEQQTATAEILKVISSSPTDIQPVFDAILENATRICGAHMGILGLYDGKTYRRVAQRGASAEFAKWLAEEGPKYQPDAHGLVAQMIAERRPIHILDRREQRAYRERIPSTVALVELGGARSSLVVPMLKEGRVVGGIVIYRPEVRPFTQKQIDLVSTFSSQAVIAIENVRLFNEIQDKSRQLEVASRHKSDFLAHMSHELRTPLNAIIGFSEALIARMFGEVNDKQNEYLHDIHSSGQHLLSLINDILDLAKVEAGRMELEVSEFNVPQALQNAMTLVRERAQNHGIALELHVDGKLGAIRADERKVKQIVLNLLSNAVKFSPDGGRVNVDAGVNDASVEISVKDTGAGIAQEDQGTLFEEFHQVGGDRVRKQEGTGLGLALAPPFRRAARWKDFGAECA